MPSNQLVYVGAVDWRHPSWEQGFYPPGLPADWALSFYNTQFGAVYLPAAVWEAATPAEWKQWLYDTQEEFVFVLEPGSGDVAPPASTRVLTASPAWSAEHVWWLDAASDLRALSQRISAHAATGTPLFVFSRAGDLAQLERVAALREVMGY